MVKLLSNNNNNSEYYRVTYNGEGIYKALKNSVNLNEWKEILSNKDICWLPKPPTYSSKCNLILLKKVMKNF